MTTQNTPRPAIRLLVRADSGDEFIGGADVVVNVTPELAALVYRRREILDRVANDDIDLLEMSFWFYEPLYFTNDADLTDEPVDIAAQLPTPEAEAYERAGHVTLPDESYVPADDTRTECSKMIFRRDGVAFSAYSKHASIPWTTGTLPYAMFDC